MTIRIHVTGASGSGTSTLGRALASRLSIVPIDVDAYFWLPSDPPFQQVRARDERQESLRAALDKAGDWILSGSLCGWGDVFIPRFDLVVFLSLPGTLRLERLRRREVARYGTESLALGGAMHQAHSAFLAWAAAYDDGGVDIRSRRLHEQWLAEITSCPAIRLDSTNPVDKLCDQVIEALSFRAAHAG